MTNVRTIHVDWYSQRPPRFSGGPQLAYQGDHLSNMVVFDNAPELPNYYLLVEMKTDDAGPVVALPEILLEGPYWVISNYYTQICQQITYQVCCKTGSGDYEHHSAKFKGTILPAITHNGEPVDLSSMFDPYIDVLDKRVNELIVAAGDIQIDAELKNDSGNPVQNRIVKAAIDGLGDDVVAVNGRLDRIEGGGAGGLTEDIKSALLACFENVAWVNANGHTYYDTLETALYPPANLTSISAVYTQSDTVYDTDSLDSLKADLVVTAHMSDNTTRIVTEYTLSGELTEGTSTIAVTYGGKTTAFTVVVTKFTIETVFYPKMTTDFSTSYPSVFRVNQKKDSNKRVLIASTSGNHSIEHLSASVDKTIKVYPLPLGNAQSVTVTSVSAFELDILKYENDNWYIYNSYYWKVSGTTIDVSQYSTGEYCYIVLLQDGSTATSENTIITLA